VSWFSSCILPRSSGGAPLLEVIACGKLAGAGLRVSQCIISKKTCGQSERISLMAKHGLSLQDFLQVRLLIIMAIRRRVAVLLA